MFSKLAIRNIRRSFKDYAIYFVTLVLGVAIFYVFNALETQSVMLGLSNYMNDIVELMNGILSGVSVFVAFVLGLLIIYASRFLIKRRSQEFGIYMTLGMSKKRISLIILLETLLIGVVSLAAGLLVGVVASQFTSALVANMFEADMTEYHFVFSSAAAFKTLIYFMIIFAVVMLLNTVIIARQKLIKLLQARKMTEVVKVHRTWASAIVLLTGVAILAWAYSMVTVRANQLDEDNIGLVILAGALGTLLFFWSFATIVVKVFQKTGLYNRGLSTFTLRQFSSVINTSAVTMTVICLMLFATICVSASAASMHESIMADIDKTMPIDLEFVAETVDGVETVDILKSHGLDIPAMLSEQVEYEMIYGDLEYSDILRKLSLSQDDLMFNFNGTVPVIRVSDYNRLSDLFHNEKLELPKDKYLIVANFPEMVKYYEQALALDTEITVGGKVLAPASTNVKDGAYQLSNSASTNIGLIVVPDDIKVSEHNKATRYLIGNFKDDIDQSEISARLVEIRDKEFDQSRQYIAIEAKQMLIDSNIGINAIVTFVALYLGIIFLIASSALLALKQLTESSDNRAKYAIIQKLGASEKMISHALITQIGIFFALPLAIALVHAIFGIIFCDYILAIFGGVKIGSAVIGTGILFLVIYGGYFWITYACSRRMIRERRI